MTLWVDTICIDQASNSERSHQIQLLAGIYNDATSVIAWLGPATATDNLVFDFLSYDNETLLKDPAAMQKAFDSITQKDIGFGHGSAKN